MTTYSSQAVLITYGALIAGLVAKLNAKGALTNKECSDIINSVLDITSNESKPVQAEVKAVISALFPHVSFRR